MHILSLHYLLLCAKPVVYIKIVFVYYTLSYQLCKNKIGSYIILIAINNSVRAYDHFFIQINYTVYLFIMYYLLFNYDLNIT